MKASQFSFSRLHKADPVLGVDMSSTGEVGCIGDLSLIHISVEKKDSIHYNQVSGKEMKAFFIDGDMRLVEVNGNVLVVYYPVAVSYTHLSSTPERN